MDAQYAMSSPADTIGDLKEKRSELKMEHERLEQKLQKLRDRIEAITKTMELFQADTPSIDDEEGKQLPGWPSGESMPKRVSHVLDKVGRIMQPHEVDEYVRANSSDDIRDNAVAETLSRLARQDKLARKDYGQSSFYYGEKQWWDKEREDFVGSVKPDQLAVPDREE